ncbi:MAG: hypothetical protein HQL67_12345 [Magnetococcales bacterium]|nr:hypothetical protein [Magnetococcales bacterium]
MDSKVSLTLDQLDTINRSLNKSTAIVQVMADCSAGKRHELDSTEAVNIFLVMQVVVEELDKIWAITKKLGDGVEE